MKVSRTHSCGFTLIEFLLYTALSVIMVSLIGSIGITVLSSKVQVRAQEELYYNSMFVLNFIESKVAQAESIVAPGVETSSTELQLRMSDPEIDPTILTFTDGALWITEGSGDPERILGSATNISDHTFTNVTTSDVRDTVRVEFTSAVTYGEHAQSEGTFYTTAATQYIYE